MNHQLKKYIDRECSKQELAHQRRKADGPSPSAIEFRLGAALVLELIENYNAADEDDLYHANCAKRMATWISENVK